MAYGHAERNLALIRQLEAETAQLLGDVAEPNPEQCLALPSIPDRGQSAAGDVRLGSGLRSAGR